MTRWADSIRLLLEVSQVLHEEAEAVEHEEWHTAEALFEKSHTLEQAALILGER